MSHYNVFFFRVSKYSDNVVIFGDRTLCGVEHSSEFCDFTTSRDMRKRRKVENTSNEESNSTRQLPSHSVLLDDGLFSTPGLERCILTMVDEFLDDEEKLKNNYHHYYVALELSNDYVSAFECVVDLLDVEKCHYIVKNFRDEEFHFYENIVKRKIYDEAERGDLDSLQCMMCLLQEISEPETFLAIVKHSLVYACHCEHVEMIKYLVTFVENDYNDAIQRASDEDNFELVKWLACVTGLSFFNPEQAKLIRRINFQLCDEVDRFKKVISLVHKDEEVYGKYLFYKVCLLFRESYDALDSYKVGNSLSCVIWTEQCGISSTKFLVHWITRRQTGTSCFVTPFLHISLQLSSNWFQWVLAKTTTTEKPFSMPAQVMT